MTAQTTTGDLADGEVPNAGPQQVWSCCLSSIGPACMHIGCSLDGCGLPAIGRYGLCLTPEITRDVQLCADCFTVANKNDRVAYTIGLAKGR